MTSIGFIGLGSMGSAMVKRLLKSGFEVSVWNRTASAADPLVQEGAIKLDSAAEAFGKDITVSILANDTAVQAVVTEEVLKNNPNAVHVNMASVSVDAARAIEKLHRDAGVRYLAAPVMGRPNVAEAGQLNILAGGAESVIKDAAPALDAIGKKTWHVSEEAAGATLVKIAVNYNLIHALQALGESMNLVERGGIDGQLFVDILTDAAFTGAVYTGYGKMIASREYFPASFDVSLGLKDLTLTEEAANELNAALPTAPAIREMFETAQSDEERREGDWSIIAEVIREK